MNPAVRRYQSSLSASMGETLTASLAGSTLAAVAASVLPAREAVKVSPIEALSDD